MQSLLDCFKQKLGLTASMCHSVLAQALSESMIQPARCALARPALARAPPLTACPSAQVNPPAGSDGDITFRLSLLASLSPVCLEDPRGQLVARLARASRSGARPRSERPIANRVCADLGRRLLRPRVRQRSGRTCKDSR